MKNYYEILQVKNFAEMEVIKASYKALCKKYHPDINKGIDPSIMVEINNAYDILGNPIEKEKYDRILQTFLIQKNNDSKQDDENNIRNYEQNIYADNDKSKTKFVVFRVPLSILISICIGMILSYFILGIISIDGTWSFIIYTFFGGIIGLLISKISGIRNNIMGAIGAIITVICIVFPFYEYLFDTLPLIYGEMYSIDFFLKATKEITHLLLGSGFIRMIFVILAPMTTFSTISDN